MPTLEELAGVLPSQNEDDTNRWAERLRPFPQHSPNVQLQRDLDIALHGLEDDTAELSDLRENLQQKLEKAEGFLLTRAERNLGRASHPPGGTDSEVDELGSDDMGLQEVLLHRSGGPTPEDAQEIPMLPQMQRSIDPVPSDRVPAQNVQLQRILNAVLHI